MWQITAFLASVALCGIGGCCGSQDTASSADAQFPLKGMELVHDFGPVVEGRVVEHIFATSNDLPVPIAIADDADIEKTCGCTTLEPSTRRLEPGGKATIRMRVNTSGKSGRFRVGAVIKWRTDSGDSWPINLYLAGTAKAILTTQPSLVQFSRVEVADRTIKELLVFNSFDVDWSTLNVQIEPPYAELVEAKVHSDHATLFVRPCPPSEMVDFSTTLRFTADLAVAKSGVRNCAISVPIQGSQSIDIQVSPRVVFASWSREFKTGTARFFVRGLASAEPASVSSISCDGFRAAWATKDISSPRATDCRTIQVELSLSEPDDPAFDSTKSRCVRIGFAGGRSLEVPVYVVAHQERS
jgi:hypothetical protein